MTPSEALTYAYAINVVIGCESVIRKGALKALV